MTEEETRIPFLYRGLIEVWGKSGHEALLDLARAWSRGCEHTDTVDIYTSLLRPDAEQPPFPIAVQYEMFYALNELVSILGIDCYETLKALSPRPDGEMPARFLDRHRAGEIDHGYCHHWSQKHGDDV